MDGPATGGRLREGAAGGRAHVEQPVVVGIVGADLAEPAGRRSVEADLVDRLTGADLHAAPVGDRT